MSLLDENLDYFPTLKEQGLLCTVVFHIQDKQDKTILDGVMDPVLKDLISQSLDPRYYEGLGTYQFYSQIERYIDERLNKLHTIDPETDISKDLLDIWPSLHIECHENFDQTPTLMCEWQGTKVITIIISKIISA